MNWNTINVIQYVPQAEHFFFTPSECVRSYVCVLTCMHVRIFVVDLIVCVCDCVMRKTTLNLLTP